MAPELRNNRGFLDLARADIGREQMIGCVFDDSKSTMAINEGSDMTYFNEMGDEVLALDDLQNIGLADGEASLRYCLGTDGRDVLWRPVCMPDVLIETMDEIGVNYMRLWKGMSGHQV